MSRATILSGKDAVRAADAVVEELIEAAKAGEERARLTKAPAGAGKTGAVTRLVDALADEDANIGVIAQTNEQAFDLVQRIADIAPERDVAFLHAADVQLPPEKMRKNVQLVAAKTLGDAQVVVATADKWAFSRPDINDGRFDAGVVDEGYQMPSAKLLRISGLFPSLDFLGDPGQLDPFSKLEISADRASYILRASDGTLRIALPADARTRLRLRILRHRPRLWRFWQIEVRRRQAQQGATERSTRAYFGRRDESRSPLLVFARAHWLAAFESLSTIELIWHPADGEHRRAQKSLIDLTRHIRVGRNIFWFRIVVWPAFMWEMLAGFSRQRTD